MSTKYYTAPVPAVKVLRDGRERCSDTPRGRNEYARRRQYAWEVQRGLCALCKRPMSLSEATADHRAPRGLGGGKRDDRQENIQAAHFWCNNAKSGRRI